METWLDSLQYITIYNIIGMNTSIWTHTGFEDLTKHRQSRVHTHSYQTFSFSFSDIRPPDSGTLGRRPTLSDTDSIRLLSQLILRRCILQTSTGDSLWGSFTDPIVCGPHVRITRGHILLITNYNVIQNEQAIFFWWCLYFNPLQCLSRWAQLILFFFYTSATKYLFCLLDSTRNVKKTNRYTKCQKQIRKCCCTIQYVESAMYCTCTSEKKVGGRKDRKENDSEN